jgi:NADH dehydrogenase [ubiquinone] 1 alpha subcomplex assembly factor 6
MKQIQSKTTNSTLAKMRFDFWRGSIESTFKGNPPNNPICTSLARVLEEVRLSQSWFKRIVNAYESELDITNFGTFDSLEAHAENKYSSLIYLNLEGLGVIDLKADHAASHIGKCIGITRILQSLPYDIQTSIHIIYSFRKIVFILY